MVNDNGLFETVRLAPVAAPELALWYDCWPSKLLDPATKAAVREVMSVELPMSAITENTVVVLAGTTKLMLLDEVPKLQVT